MNNHGKFLPTTNKHRKPKQLSGGWAKHAYGDEHYATNRRERRQSKQLVKLMMRSND